MPWPKCNGQCYIHVTKDWDPRRGYAQLIASGNSSPTQDCGGCEGRNNGRDCCEAAAGERKGGCRLRGGRMRRRCMMPIVRDLALTRQRRIPNDTPAKNTPAKKKSRLNRQQRLASKTPDLTSRLEKAENIAENAHTCKRASGPKNRRPGGTGCSVGVHKDLMPQSRDRGSPRTTPPRKCPVLCLAQLQCAHGDTCNWKRSRNARKAQRPD
jgi:hypothetical protein